MQELTWECPLSGGERFAARLLAGMVTNEDVLEVSDTQYRVAERLAAALGVARQLDAVFSSDQAAALEQQAQEAQEAARILREQAISPAIGICMSRRATGLCMSNCKQAQRD